MTSDLASRSMSDGENCSVPGGRRRSSEGAGNGMAEPYLTRCIAKTLIDLARVAKRAERREQRRATAAHADDWRACLRERITSGCHVRPHAHHHSVQRVREALEW